MSERVLFEWEGGRLREIGDETVIDLPEVPVMGEQILPAWTEQMVFALLAALDEERAKVERLRERSIDEFHLERQRSWSAATFGPGDRTAGVVDHIRKELAEIEADPGNVMEWADVVILAFDGAWRAGWEPQQIIDAVKNKQATNELREWPDWRTQDAGKAIEHVCRAADTKGRT